MPIPVLLYVLGAAIGGIAVGALARQPEINRLKNQIKKLQDEIQRLQKCIAEQQRQINELKIRFNALKAWNFSKKIDTEGCIKGKILLLYALFEYLRIAQKKIEEANILEEEESFFKIFDAIISGRGGSKEHFMEIKRYLIGKCSYEIKHFIPPDKDTIVEAIKCIN